MEVCGKMSIHVVCQYGSGDRPIEAVSDNLIITEGEARKRGYTELNIRWKVKSIYDFTIPFPKGGHILRPGLFVRVTCPELGLLAEDLYVAKLTLAGDIYGVVMRLVCEKYQDWEESGKVQEEGN